MKLRPSSPTPTAASPAATSEISKICDRLVDRMEPSRPPEVSPEAWAVLTLAMAEAAMARGRVLALGRKAGLQPWEVTQIMNAMPVINPRPVSTSEP